MFDYLTKTSVVNLKEFALDSINYLGLELGAQFEIALTDGGEWNFDKSFLYINVKNINAKITFNLTVNTEY